MLAQQGQVERGVPIAVLVAAVWIGSGFQQFLNDVIDDPVLAAATLKSLVQSLAAAQIQEAG